jgi:uncharacterized coiled-coil protein SlyX
VASAIPEPDPVERRLTSLEEHAGFAEHTVEQLSAEVAECNKRVHALAVRLAAMEERLGRLLQPPGGDDAAAGETRNAMPE